MSLIKCKECGHEVSTEAKACPNCGWMLPAKIGFGQVFLIIFIIAIYVGIYNMLTDNKLDEPEKSKVSNTPELQVTADKILLAYQNDKIRADSYYKNKLIRISGIINDFGKDNSGTPYVFLNSKQPIFTVQCKFEKSLEGTLVNLKKGHEITIVGRVSGEFSNIILILENCLVDKYNENSPSSLSQQEIKICNAYSNKTDKNACLKEFEDKKKEIIDKTLNNSHGLPANSEKKNEDDSASNLTPKEIILKKLKMEFSWSINEFGTMDADFIIRNNSDSKIKDIEITCIHFGQSGTIIDKNIRKIYEIFPANSKMEINNFNMGFIHSQSYKSLCTITDFDY